MVKTALLLGVLLFSLGSPLGVAFGHIRYVLNDDEIANVQDEGPLMVIQADNLAVLMLSGLLLIVVVQFGGAFLTGRSIIIRAEGVLSSIEEYAPLILRVMVGGFLVLSAAAGQLFSPQPGIGLANLQTPISIIQLVAGGLLLLGFLTKVGALLLGVLVAASFFVLGVHGLDQFALLGVAFLLFFEGGLRQSIDSITLAKVRILGTIGERLDRLKIYSMPAMRTSLGITLVWLGLTEKLLAPQLTEAAILKYDVPFFPELRLFVFLFGFFEILLGLHYLLGIFNRLVSVLYLGLLATAFVLFGEGANHLHLFGIAVVFLIRGAGPFRMSISGLTKTE
ncbi:MAG: hypothetical protein ACE5KG_06845 [Nitrososphaerales archaeon]